MAGNIKGFHDRQANPVRIVPETDKQNIDYKMCTAYTDGTKLNIEMALVANALGYRTDLVGMHGPRAAHVENVPEKCDLEGMRNRGSPVVDYVLGIQPGVGVFVVGHCDHSYQKSMLAYCKLGDGPWYVFYRPYQLCHVKTLRCAAEAVLDG